MTVSVAIDILIGLFTLYFVMSTLSSALVEIVSNLLALRSKMLKSFLEFQFYRLSEQNRGRVGQGFSNVITELVKKYPNGLSFLKRFTYDLGSEEFALDPSKFYKIQGTNFPVAAELIPLRKNLLPSIKSDNFAQALNVLIGLTGEVELVIPVRKKAEFDNFKAIVEKILPQDANIQSVLDALKKATDRIDTELDDIKAEKDANKRKVLLATLQTSIQSNMDILEQKIANIQGANSAPIATAFDDLKRDFRAIDRIGTNPVDAGIEDLKLIVTNLPESQIKNVLINSIQQTGQSINDVSTHVANWFDGEMERLSEIYKRRTQLFLFITGLAVSFILNVNTVDIADALAKNPALREALVAQGQSIADKTGKDKESWQNILDQLNALTLPIGNRQCPTKKIDTTQPQNNSGISPTSAATLEANSTPEATSTLEASPTPQVIETPQNQQDNSGNNSPAYLSLSVPLSCNDNTNILGIFGKLITAAAVALGAPFWFDLLKSLTSSGSKDETATKT